MWFGGKAVCRIWYLVFRVGLCGFGSGAVREGGRRVTRPFGLWVGWVWAVEGNALLVRGRAGFTSLCRGCEGVFGMM